MTKKEADRQSGSERERERAAMLEAALVRPGVREAMQVYGGWREKDRELDAYRSAAKTTRRVTTTDRSTPRWTGG